MEELKIKLVNLCNQSKLPLEALYFVVKDLYRDVEDSVRAYKEQERMNLLAQAESEDDEEIEEEIIEEEEE